MSKLPLSLDPAKYEIPKALFFGFHIERRREFLQKLQSRHLRRWWVENRLFRYLFVFRMYRNGASSPDEENK